MKSEEFLSLLLLIALGLFLVRWLINWKLLNLKNGTSFSMFGANYSQNDLWGMFRHMAISEWNIWWFDLQDQRTMKIISNILSTIIYTVIVGTIITFFVVLET